MSHTASRREFLKSVGLATSALGLGGAALAQEKGQSPKDARGNGAQLQEHPYELMICDYVRFKLSKVDKRGKIIWEHSPEGKVWDFVITDDNMNFPKLCGHSVSIIPPAQTVPGSGSPMLSAGVLGCRTLQCIQRCSTGLLTLSHTARDESIPYTTQRRNSPSPPCPSSFLSDSYSM